MGCVQEKHYRFCLLWVRMNHLEEYLMVSSREIDSQDDISRFYRLWVRMNHLEEYLMVSSREVDSQDDISRFYRLLVRMNHLEEYLMVSSREVDTQDGNLVKALRSEKHKMANVILEIFDVFSSE